MKKPWHINEVATNCNENNPFYYSRRSMVHKRKRGYDSHTHTHTHTHTLMLIPVLCLEDQDPNSKSLRTRQFLLVTSSWSGQIQRGSTFQRKHLKKYT
jgi:hypothetical protein